MPGQDGKLTPDEYAKVREWLKRFPESENTACPVCKSQEWLIAEHVVQPITVTHGNAFMMGGIGYPQVMLISLPCGYTRFMNSVVMGISPPADIQSPSDKPEEK